MNRLILDTETAGNIEDHDSLRVYDFAYQIVDDSFRVVCTRHFLISEVFNDLELMSSAYYSKKLPLYFAMLASQEVEIVPFLTAYNQFLTDCKDFKVKQIWAYNAAFDRDALNATLKALSNGFRSWFMPYGIKIKCIWSLCSSTILNRPSYFKFALKNGFVSSKGNLATNAEVAYAYMTNDPTYKEEHTALEDVKIERELLSYGLRQHVKDKQTKIKRNAWSLPQKKFKEWLNK